jgi:caffeoyl-CoA O-methyltransferase
MSDDVYTRVDTYIADLFGDPDPVMAAAAERSDAAGLPQIAVSASHGRLLHVLALARGARSILEIGTLGGYSTIWLARALPSDGRLISLESEPEHAEVARRNIDAARLADRVEIRVGRALDTLGQLEAEGAGPFDLVFIDADKDPYAEYLQAAVRMGRAGTLIVADNVVRGGAVLDEDTHHEATRGVQRFNAALAADERLTGTILQEVGVKGHDGMAFAVIRES